MGVLISFHLPQEEVDMYPTLIQRPTHIPWNMLIVMNRCKKRVPKLAKWVRFFASVGLDLVSLLGFFDQIKLTGKI
ncbi:MAG: hypothetical protein ACI8SI_002492 [Congregibacter sp.]|jgi:hypothetical protein